MSLKSEPSHLREAYEKIGVGPTDGLLLSEGDRITIHGNPRLKGLTAGAWAVHRVYLHEGRPAYHFRPIGKRGDPIKTGEVAFKADRIEKLIAAYDHAKRRARLKNRDVAPAWWPSDEDAQRERLADLADALTDAGDLPDGRAEALKVVLSERKRTDWAALRPHHRAALEALDDPLSWHGVEEPDGAGFTASQARRTTGGSDA